MFEGQEDLSTPTQPTLTLEDFDYSLPEELIAQFPTSNRTASRLLHLDAHGQLADRSFSDIMNLLCPGDLLIFNDTRVIKARLWGNKVTGGKIEALIERITGTDEALAHLKSSKSPKPGSRLAFADSVACEVLRRQDDLFHLRFDRPVIDVLENYGHVPLPPYIQHDDTKEDLDRYQTVYARHPGAVAAPTAGLHFDEHLLKKMKLAGIDMAFVTLHVGAGTFRPVRDNDISKHKMHSEWYTISPECVHAIEQAKARGSRIIAVGTTSVRALESCASKHGGRIQSGSDDTQLFITPGFQWHVVDAMVTNFHLPKSTLLMLVAAFCGLESMRKAYAHAVAQRYRFFSYGDAMFIERPTQEKGIPHAV